MSIQDKKYRKKVKRIKLFLNIITDGWKRAKYLKRKKIFYYMGENVYYHTRILPTEPFLVSIGNNVRIAANVRLITHDITSNMINQMTEYSNDEKLKYYIGRINICDNVMIGADSIILYNVTIGANTIVAAGSVVTKDVPSGSVVGGNPAKVIGSFDEFVNKRKISSLNTPSIKDGIDCLIDYFWRNENGISK